MTDSVIKIENLGKSYLIGHNAYAAERYTALRDIISRKASSVVRKTRDLLAGRVAIQGHEVEEFWALKDISFNVKRGDVVGIIGRNGAGKSTLLKVLSRITLPTTGRVTIRGRVASLLEVGTGFHPELTGRENIFLNGAIMGMTRNEIRRKFDEIVDFADVEKFLDTPVKHFSSGMYVRLAFAVAAHLEPEILLIDEALAVGDAQFQKKCLGKMEDVANEGRTVLFVSHNMAAVQNLCRKGVFLQAGRLGFIGSQTGAIGAYLASTRKNKSLATRTDRIGTGDVRVESFAIVDVSGAEIDPVMSGQELAIRLYFRKCGTRSLTRLLAGITVKTLFDVHIFLHHSRLTGDVLSPLPKQGYFEIRIPRLPLPASSYRIDYSIMHDGEYIDSMNDAAELTVVDGDFYGTGEIPPATHGVCLIDGHWSIHKDDRALEQAE